MLKPKRGCAPVCLFRAEHTTKSAGLKTYPEPLLASCRYGAEIVQDLRHGLLSHTVVVRRAGGERLVTFDQWAQLFDWVGHHLDIHEPAQLKLRLGVDFSAPGGVQARSALGVRSLTSRTTAAFDHSSYVAWRSTHRARGTLPHVAVESVFKHT